MTKTNISTDLEGCNVFNWPEFDSDKERIKMNSLKYSNCTISEAFKNEYNVNVTTTKEIEIPRELRVGDVFKVDINNVSKRFVEFSNTNLKSNLHSITDLYKYPKFRDNTSPIKDVSAQVVSVDKSEVRVDLIAPLLNEYLTPIISNNWIQKKMSGATPIKVKNLKLTRGGFIGRAVIPNVSEFLGEDFEINAFIPGSQIVLNIADVFERFENTTVDAFIVNYIQRPGTNTMSLICSVKEYLRYKGEMNMINMFKDWCENSNSWKTTSEMRWIGKVTGVINSSKKCGIFVEIPELFITGMVPMSPGNLVNYKPGDALNVYIKGFEEEFFFNQHAQQLQHVDPYKITNGCIEQCTLKPILEIAY